IASAVFTEQGKVLHKKSRRLKGRAGRAVGTMVREEIIRLVGLARRDGLDVEGVGISVPGIADVKSGRVWAPNIPAWKNYPLRREIESFFHSRRRESPPGPVIIDSDRTCSILGEMWQGAAKKCNEAIFLAVGTGIGAGILTEGRVLRGAQD